MFNPPITGNGELDAYLAQLALETDANNGVLVDSNTGKIYDGNTGNILYYLYQYIQVKYADDNIGTNLSNSPTNKLFFGINNNASTTESTNPADYTWYLASGGFSTNKFLFYLVNGGRQILFAVATSAPSSSYVVDSGSAIDLDVVTASTANAAAAAAQSTATAAQSTANTAVSNAATAQSTADSAVSGLSGKLNKSASDILSGDITFNSAGGFKTGTIAIDGSGNVTGAGVAFTSKGITGRTAGATTFTIESTTGNATFKGDINTDGDAIFKGSNPQLSFPIDVAGITYFTDYTVYGEAITPAASSSLVRTGILGVADANVGIFNVGVVGVGADRSSFSGMVRGIGVVGQGDFIGGTFNSSKNIGTALVANHSLSPYHPAFYIVQGQFIWGSYTIAQPTGSTSTFLRNDGQWATPSGGSGTVTSVSGTGSVSGLTLSGTVTTSGNLTLGGSLSLNSGDVTGALGYTPYSNSNPSGFVTSSGSVAYATNAGSATYATSAGSASTASYATSAGSASYAANAGDSSGLGGVNSSSWARIFVGDTGTGNAAGAGMNFNCLISGYQFRGTSNFMYLEPVSDRRLKENIQPETLGLNFVNSLKPVTYNMIGKQKKSHGFIAQDVENLIDDNNDSLKIENEEGIKGIDYMSLIAPLVKSIQELTAKIEVLETKLKG